MYNSSSNEPQKSIEVGATDVEPEHASRQVSCLFLNEECRETPHDLTSDTSAWKAPFSSSPKLIVHASYDISFSRQTYYFTGDRSK